MDRNEKKRYGAIPNLGKSVFSESFMIAPSGDNYRRATKLAKFDPNYITWSDQPAPASALKNRRLTILCESFLQRTKTGSRPRSNDEQLQDNQKQTVFNGDTGKNYPIEENED